MIPATTEADRTRDIEADYALVTDGGTIPPHLTGCAAAYIRLYAEAKRELVIQRFNAMNIGDIEEAFDLYPELMKRFAKVFETEQDAHPTPMQQVHPDFEVRR